AFAAASGAVPGGEPAGESRQRGNRGGEPLAGRRERAERPVLQHHVIEVGGGLPSRPGGLGGPVSLQDQGAVGVGKGEELEVVVRVGTLLEAVKYLLAGMGRVDPLQSE